MAFICVVGCDSKQGADVIGIICVVRADTEPGDDSVYLSSGGLIPSRALMRLFVQLELIPSQALMACSELLHLDLSNNELDALPPQLRRKQQLSVFRSCSVVDPYRDRHQSDADPQH
jgi:hypothetical protein